MRLATWNLLHGRSLSDGQVVASRLAEAARTLGADVVGLQEVDRAQARSGARDLTAEVADALGAVDFRFAAALIGTPGEEWRAAEDADEGTPGPAYGVGLVSRLPVLQWRTVRLAAAPVRSPVALPGSRRVILLPDEPRVGLAAVVDAPGGVLTVVTTHLSFVPGWNVVQLRRLVAGLRDLPRPLVLLGDLNMPPPVPSLTTRWRALARTATYPVDAPRWQLDHVLGTRDVPAVLDVQVLPLGVSDHCALVVEL